MDDVAVVNDACAFLGKGVTRVRLTRDLAVSAERFEWDLRGGFGDGTPLARGRVILGSGTWARPLLHPLGEPGDAVLVSRERISLLERAPLRNLQRTHGYVSMAAQLGRLPAEAFHSYRYAAEGNAPLVRHGTGQWTLRSGGQIRKLEAGDHVALTDPRGGRWLFFPQSRDVPRAEIRPPAE